MALYFAVANEKHHSQNGAVWAFNPFKLNELQDMGKMILGIRHPQIERLVSLAFNRVTPDDNAAIATLPDEIDIRMLVQLSGMTIHGSPEPLETREGNDSFLRKFEISSEYKDILRSRLGALGIRERNLFPDLEHLAKDLKKDNYPD